jgi:hypothetical protein
MNVVFSITAIQLFFYSKKHALKFLYQVNSWQVLKLTNAGSKS